MGAIFWIKRFFVVYAGVFLVLVLAERIKGHDWHTAIAFSAVWALVSTGIFVRARRYQAKRGQACAICRDTPE